MAFNNEQATVEIIVNSQQAADRLRELDRITAQLTKQINGMASDNPERAQLKKTLREYNNEAKQLKQQLSNRVDLVINGTAANATMQELQVAANRLWMELRKLPKTSDEFTEKTAQFQRVKKELNELQETVKGTEGWFSRIKKELSGMAGVAVGYLGLQALGNQISNIISKNAQLSDSLAQVRMTTGLTEKEVSELNQAFAKMDTRTAKSDLLDIAKVGGQFGVAKEDLLGFTEAINKATVVLKSEFKGGAEEITTTLAGLRNVFTDFKTANINDDLTKLGNGLIVLAQEGRATAPVVADFANRIAGTAVPMGVTTGQILGLSATLQELSISTERGGTAVGKILQKMATNTEEFAKIANKSTDEFKQMVNKDIMGAFQEFLKGTVRFKGDAVAMGGSLKDLETSGAGVSEVLGKLGGQTGLLSEKIKTASKAIKDNSEITKQYELANNTLGARLDRLGKAFYQLVSNGAVSQFLGKAVDVTLSFVNSLSKLSEWLSNNTAMLTALGTITATYYANVIKATIVTAADTAAKALNVLWYKQSAAAATTETVAKSINTAATERATAATVTETAAKASGEKVSRLSAATDVIVTAAKKAYALAVGVLTNKIKLAEAAQIAFNAVMRMNPVGLVITALGTAVVAWDYYTKNTKEAVETERKKAELSKELIKVTNDLTLANEVFSMSIQKTNTLSREEQLTLEKNIELKLKDAQATLEQLKAKQSDVKTRETKTSVWQTVGNTVSSAVLNFGTTGGGATAFAAAQAADAMQNGAEAAGKYNDQIKGVEQAVSTMKNSLIGFTGTLHAEEAAMKINAVTLDQYNEKISLLQQALRSVTIDSADYARIQKEIAETQAQLNKKTPQGNNGIAEGLQKSEAALKEFQGKYSELLKNIEQMKIALIADDRQRAFAELAFKRKLEEEKANQELSDILKNQNISSEKKKQYTAQTNIELELIEAKYLQDKKNLEEKFFKEQSEWEYKESVTNLAKWHSEEKNKIAQAYEDKKLTKQQYNEQLYALEENYYDMLGNLAKDYGKESSDAENKARDAKLKGQQQALEEEQKQRLAALELSIIMAVDGSNEELNARKNFLTEKANIEMAAMEQGSNEQLLAQAELHQQLEQMDREFIANKISEYAAVANQLLSIAQTMSQMAAEKDQKDLRKYKQYQKDRTKELDRQLKAGLISREKYDAEIQIMNDNVAAKEAEAKRKAFKAQQAFAIVQAVINTALAITSALNTQPFMPMGPIMAALAAVLGAVQISAISSQSMPQFAEGRKPVSNSVVTGPSHQQGGINLVTADGSVVGNMEGDEGIFSKKAYANNTEIINAIFDADGARVTLKGLPRELFSDENKQRLTDISSRALASTNSTQLVNALKSYENYSNSLVEMHRNTNATHMQLDNMLEENNIARTRSHLQWQERVSQTTDLQNALQVSGGRIAAIAEQNMNEVQQRRWSHHMAQVISDFDDKVISKEQFSQAEERINFLRSTNAIPDQFNPVSGERKKYIDPLAPVIDNDQKPNSSLEKIMQLNTDGNPFQPEWIGQKSPQVSFEKVTEILNQKSEYTNSERILMTRSGAKNNNEIAIDVNNQEQMIALVASFTDAVNRLHESSKNVSETMNHIRENGIEGKINYYSLKREEALINDITSRAKIK